MLHNHINDCLLWPADRPKALFKQQPEDFVVHEILDWDFTGVGEHIFLYVEKTLCNTVWVAKQLAKFYGVPPRDVGYSGLKDRHAVTRQYFSVRLPGVKPDSYAIPEHDEFSVVSHTLHDRKLKRGNHSCNEFTITLKDITGDMAVCAERLAFIRDNGCPNFFDSQRFGHDNNNLRTLEQWSRQDIELRKRADKSIVISAFRSALFNGVLARRVQAGTWNTIESGDTVLLDGSNSFFVAESCDEQLLSRAHVMDVHPAGLLVGADDYFGDNDGVDAEHLRVLLRREHVEAGRRSLRNRVTDLEWEFRGDVCIVRMRLPTGAYASGVIKQVFDIE